MKRDFRIPIDEFTQFLPSCLDPFVVITHDRTAANGVVWLIAGKGLMTRLVQEYEQPVIRVLEILERVAVHWKAILPIFIDKIHTRGRRSSRKSQLAH